MPVGIIMEFDGFSEEQYEVVRERINWPENWADGIKLHIAGPSESGMRIVEVWDSRAEYDRWMDETIYPVVQEIAGDFVASGPPPRITEFSVSREESRDSR
jgi:hypothetical protein